MEEQGFDRLDYTIHEAEERVALVERICQEYQEAGIEINQQYLTIMADYCLCLDLKKEYKDKTILTKNRMTTIYKREISYEGLQDALPGGDDSIQELINDNPKSFYLTNRNKITNEDLEKYPELKILKENIYAIQQQIEHTNPTGKRLFLLKKMIIELQQEMYVVKTMKEEKNLGLLNSTRAPKSTAHLEVSGELYMDEEGNVISTDIVDLSNPDHVREVLKMYSTLKQDTWDHFDMPLKYLLWDLENIADYCMENKKPAWYKILIRKIDGAPNETIAAELKEELGVELSVNTISTVWCNGIPKLIAEEAERRNTVSYYKEHGMPMKKCSKCGRLLPASHLFFHTNNKAGDRLYSICKDCRKV